VECAFGLPRGGDVIENITFQTQKFFGFRPCIVNGLQTTILQDFQTRAEIVV